MRLRSLFLLDLRFQAKYGFYFLYTILTVIYVVALMAVPESWREKTAAILIFSDPASMGLLFMGAIVLLEKNQHTPCAFAVSPVRPMEYIIAKVSSLSAISLVVAAVLAIAAGVDNNIFCSSSAKRDYLRAVHPDAVRILLAVLPCILLGTLLSSVIFTLLGIIIATKITSLNQFILWTVPIEIVCFVPAILHLFKITPAWLRYYPVNVCMEMVSGYAPSATGIFIVTALMAVLLVLSKNCVLKMWNSMGGVKL